MSNNGAAFWLLSPGARMAPKRLAKAANTAFQIPTRTHAEFPAAGPSLWHRWPRIIMPAHLRIFTVG